jgi:hypothetical protein
MILVETSLRSRAGSSPERKFYLRPLGTSLLGPVCSGPVVNNEGRNNRLYRLYYRVRSQKQYRFVSVPFKDPMQGS